MPTDNSATRSTTGAHSCRARCTRMASRAATATIPTAASCAPRATPSARPVTCQASTTRRRTITTSPPAPALRASPATCRRRPIWSSIRATITACACRGRICPLSSVRQTRATSCHTNRDARWAASQVKTWYGHDPQGYQRFAAAFSAANAGALDAQAQLRAIAADASHPAIVRATALAQLNASDSQRGLETFAEGLRDPNPLLRLAALQSLANAPLAARLSLAAPLLSDPLKAMRIEAVSVLAPVPADQLSAEQRARFRARERGIRRQPALQCRSRRGARQPRNVLCEPRRCGEGGNRIQGRDRSRSQLCSCIRESWLTCTARASAMRKASASCARDSRSRRRSAMLHHALGLALVRMKRTDAALARTRAARPSWNPATRALPMSMLSRCILRADRMQRSPGLKKHFGAHPNDRDILEALASFHQARGDSGVGEKIRRASQSGGRKSDKQQVTMRRRILTRHQTLCPRSPTISWLQSFIGIHLTQGRQARPESLG